jgi:exonuclease SbcD
MRIIHTADWHLGQTFYEFDRSSEHSAFLEWLLKVLEGNAAACGTQAYQPKADVLLIAGDVFDTANPSAESQRMYYKFLADACKRIPGLKTVIIAGNHDSAARLEAPSALLDAFDIHVVGKVRDADGNADLSKMAFVMGGLNVIAVPFTRNIVSAETKGYSEGIAGLYGACLEYGNANGFDSSFPTIGMGHMFMNGGSIRNGEKTDHLGNVEKVEIGNISTTFDYFALGHLHMEQEVSNCCNVRYAGSPIPMSFTEHGNLQGVDEILFEGGSKVPSIRQISYESPIKLLYATDKAVSVDEVANAITRMPVYDPEWEPFLQVNVKTDFFSTADRKKIDDALSGKNIRLVKIDAERLTPKSEAEDSIDLEKLLSERTDPMDIVKDVYRRSKGTDIPDEFERMMKDIVNKALNSENGNDD